MEEGMGSTSDERALEKSPKCKNLQGQRGWPEPKTDT